MSPKIAIYTSSLSKIAFSLVNQISVFLLEIQFIGFDQKMMNSGWLWPLFQLHLYIFYTELALFNSDKAWFCQILLVLLFWDFWEIFWILQWKFAVFANDLFRAIHDIVFSKLSFEQVYMKLMSAGGTYEFANLSYADISDSEDED